MKKLMLILGIFLSLNSFSQKKDVIKISNDSSQYEVTIFYPGFDLWLATSARPRGFYSLQYLETQNKYYVTEWNYRYMSSKYNAEYNYYIHYDFDEKYGYEVNYLLFNYFQYFMIKTGNRIGIRNR